MSGHGHAFDSPQLVALLEAEGELSSALVEEAISVCAGLLDDAGSPVRRVVDLGCGPGVATGLLARAFPSASLLAVDGARAMLERTQARATRLGYASRLATRRLDLDGDLASLGRCDLAWAAMAIHHADDEVATLRRIGSLLAPDGLVCVLERADPTVVRLADDFGRPGIWDRLAAARAVWFERARDRMPGARNAEAYPSMLAAAGLRVTVDRTLVGTVRATADAATQQFIARHLEHTAKDLAGLAAEADVQALRTFVSSAPDGRRTGATVTTSRKLLVATPVPG